MAIHYDPKSKRFRDDSGRLVSKDRAMRSSVARAEYDRALRKKAPPKKAPPKKAPPKKAPPKKVPPKKAPPKASPKAPPKKVPPKKAPPKKAPPKKAPPKVSRAKLPSEFPKRVRRHDPFEDGVPPWDREGVVREYPADDEWFVNDGYGYEDLIDEWGAFDDEETDS